MRLVRFAKGFATYLNEPECELEYKGCRKRASAFYNIHGCASYYACTLCGNALAAQMLRSFIAHERLTCKRCGKDVTKLRGYLSITELKEENEKKPTGG